MAPSVTIVINFMYRQRMREFFYYKYVLRRGWEVWRVHPTSKSEQEFCPVHNGPTFQHVCCLLLQPHSFCCLKILSCRKYYEVLDLLRNIYVFWVWIPLMFIAQYKSGNYHKGHTRMNFAGGTWRLIINVLIKDVLVYANLATPKSNFKNSQQTIKS